MAQTQPSDTTQGVLLNGAFRLCTLSAASVIGSRVTRPPPQDAFTRKEWKLIQRLNTPAKVQRWLTRMPYNWERQGGTMRSFRE